MLKSKSLTSNMNGPLLYTKEYAKSSYVTQSFPVEVDTFYNINVLSPLSSNQLHVFSSIIVVLFSVNMVMMLSTVEK